MADFVGQSTWGATASDLEATARHRARIMRCEEIITKHVLPLGHGHSTKMNAWVKSDPNTEDILEYRISCPCGALIVVSGDEKRVEEDRAAFIGHRELEEIRKNFNWANGSSTSSQSPRSVSSANRNQHHQKGSTDAAAPQGPLGSLDG